MQFLKTSFVDIQRKLPKDSARSRTLRFHWNSEANYYGSKRFHNEREKKESRKRWLTWRRGLSFGRKLPIVLPYTSQVEKWIRRLLLPEQYFTYENKAHQIINLQRWPSLLNWEHKHAHTRARTHAHSNQNIKKRESERKRNLHTYHRNCVDKIAVDGIKGSRIVVRRSTDRSKIYRLPHASKIPITKHEDKNKRNNKRPIRTKNEHGSEPTVHPKKDQFFKQPRTKIQQFFQELRKTSNK